MSYVCVIKHKHMIKSDLFDQELQELAEIGKVLSHPARLSILRYLAACKSCVSGDITDEIPLSRTTVSQHLKELKKIGFIKGEVDGLNVHYCLDQEKIKQYYQEIQSFFDHISKDNSNC